VDAYNQDVEDEASAPHLTCWCLACEAFAGISSFSPSDFGGLVFGTVIAKRFYVLLAAVMPRRHSMKMPILAGTPSRG